MDELKAATEQLVTIGTALKVLDPPMPRRSLARMLSKLESVGVVCPPKGGTLARTYRWSDVARAHAEWVRRKSQGLS